MKHSRSTKIYKTNGVFAIMANAIVTMRIMPEGLEVDLKKVAAEAEAKIDAFVGKSMEKQISFQPIAFGLKAVEIMFMMNESLGSPDAVADTIATIEGVQNAEVTNVTRAMG